MRVDAGSRTIRVWLEGRIILALDNPKRNSGIVELNLSKGDMLGPINAMNLSFINGQYVPVDLRSYCNNDAGQDIGDGWAVRPGYFFRVSSYDILNGIPFSRGTRRDATKNLSLKTAIWTEWKDDPSSYYENYDSLPLFEGDQRTNVLRIPNACYSAAYVLGFAENSPETGDIFSLRIGKFDGLGIYCDTSGVMPRWNEVSKTDVVSSYPVVMSNPAAGEKEGRIFLVRIPIGNVFSQDFLEYGDSLDVEITKQLRLAVRQPDLCRFRTRPLGKPSGVHIFAITFERSPVQMEVKSSEIGNVFNEPQVPSFSIKLANITEETRRVNLVCRAVDPEGSISEKTISATIPALGQTIKTVSFAGIRRGYYDISISLVEGKNCLLVRRTSFALLPPDDRDRSVDAPWGTWNFGGGHNTPSGMEQVGPLMKKLGIRYSFGASDSELLRYGIRHYGSPRVQTAGCLQGVLNYLQQYPNAVRRGLTFHEDAISGAHVMRIPDCFLNRSPYVMDESEKARFKTLWDGAVAAAKEVRGANIPGFTIQFGNGNPQIVEEFLRNRYPGEYFDTVGNENCGFMRPTEFPPDIVSFNTIWMFRQIMDFYGYQDKPLDICYEWMCRSTNPGNLSEKDQANYYVRDGIFGLVWGFKFINPGLICDVGNSYYYSNWGACGFTHRKPELNPKPSYVAFATLTRILDRAKFVKMHDTGSLSLFCVEFLSRQNNHIYVLWTLRENRDITLFFDRDCKVVRTDWMSRETSQRTTNMRLATSVCESPVYFETDASLLFVSAGASRYAISDRDVRIISPMDNLSDWIIEQGRNTELEAYNFDTPRREGRFGFSIVSNFEEPGKAIKITPYFPLQGTAIQPMYKIMTLKNPIVLRGIPEEIGIKVNGNSGWGRLIFELVDASGQRWISIGCSMGETPTRWMADWLPKEEFDKLSNIQVADWNTNDSEGRSFINFDGWRYIMFPLPGQYDGEGYHWPRNGYWKYDRDGKVHYPLALTRVIVELREKVVYGKDFVEPKRKEIYIKNLAIR
jgi:hypothetical protein